MRRMGRTAESSASKYIGEHVRAGMAHVGLQRRGSQRPWAPASSRRSESPPHAQDKNNPPRMRRAGRTAPSSANTYSGHAR
eukprot:13156855-Alexandrium_andersonii.AAC.1